MQTIKPWRFLVIIVLLGFTAFYVYSRAEAVVPVHTPFNQFPQQVGEWSMIGEARFDERVLKVLKPTDYLSRTYLSEEGQNLSLYVGYHDGGIMSGSIHSPRQCLPGSGWNRLYSQVRKVKLGSRTIPYISSFYQKGLEKQLFLYWFQVRDRILTNEYTLKLAIAQNVLLSNRRESSFIRISLMATDREEEATKVGEQFIRDFYPSIRATLPE
ncbi:MAG: EpsI family protein [Desulfuromusa sp.]|nr:EpsI family protein [Desulfuromusa sp.]